MLEFYHNITLVLEAEPRYEEFYNNFAMEITCLPKTYQILRYIS